jgi:hypothetical protein
MIVKFSTTDKPEATFPPPRAAPLEAVPALPVTEEVALTVPPRISKPPTNVEFPVAAGPAPIPVPPVDVIEPFIISINWHLPFAAVPIPDPVIPPLAVSEPPSADAKLTLENPAHSRPVEYTAAFVSLFSFPKTIVTELSEIANG